MVTCIDLKKNTTIYGTKSQLWFQIRITNGLNFMHQKWYTGNQYMVKSAENRMRSNLERWPLDSPKVHYSEGPLVRTF
jgi:hypothetical protein